MNRRGACYRCDIRRTASMTITQHGKGTAEAFHSLHTGLVVRGCEVYSWWVEKAQAADRRCKFVGTNIFRVDLVEVNGLYIRL